MLAPRLVFSLSPRFIEAAAALTIAYLAFEIVLLPDSRHRWIVVGVLGLFHGAYFSIFLAQSGYRAPAFLSGVALAELLLIALFALLLGGLARLNWMRRAVPVAASLLLVAGIVWFFVRLRA
jgi:HupE / UreJ protein